MMKNIWITLMLCAVNTIAMASDLGQTTYVIACQNCHAPQLAPAIKAPAAFDHKAWQARFERAKKEVQLHPTEYKTPLDYLLSSVKTGKGLMHHGGLCHEADVSNKNCSDEALKQAIQYMSKK